MKPDLPTQYRSRSEWCRALYYAGERHRPTLATLTGLSQSDVWYALKTVREIDHGPGEKPSAQDMDVARELLSARYMDRAERMRAVAVAIMHARARGRSERNGGR